MILSVSRRTDIPNYYADWFLERLQQGYLDVRNPINAHQVSRIPLAPELIDCIVFWSKNPENLMKRLPELEKYLYYFQFTLTDYGREIEPGLPERRRLIETFRELASRIGKKRVIWRYDPIFLSEAYTLERHLRAFREIGEELRGSTERVMISFMDFYAKTRRNMKELGIRPMEEAEMRELAAGLAEIAGELGLPIFTCAEEIDLSAEGILHGKCIDKELIQELGGGRMRGKKDKNQRKICGCMESIEVGTYHTCLTGCKYCYANFSPERVRRTVQSYGLHNSMLCALPQPGDEIKVRPMRRLRRDMAEGQRRREPVLKNKE